MRQRTFASQAEFQKYGRKSRRELFLDEMELVVPWSGLLALVRPHYAKAGNGCRPVGLEIMLRTYFVQQWFNLSDPGVEDALYESPVLQRLVRHNDNVFCVVSNQASLPQSMEDEDTLTRDPSTFVERT